MMDGFADVPIIKRTFEEASDVLKLDMWAMAANGPAETQNQTINTQPLMLCAGFATFRGWQEKGGGDPACFAGHSLGEYTALVASGALQFADALSVVRLRAQAMQDAVPEGSGGIAAVLGLSVKQVRAICADVAGGEVLEAVNLNSPTQVVIAGHRTAVERGMALAKARGAKRTLMLPMSVPSHCALMKPAAEKLAIALRGIGCNVPVIPVIQNADVSTFLSADNTKKALIEQLYRPVRWIETIQAIALSGVTAVVECVPGKVLTGLNKRIDAALDCIAISDTATLVAAVDLTR